MLTTKVEEGGDKINFSKAQPPPGLIPFELLKSAVANQPWTAAEGFPFLGYGDRRGPKELLSLIASFISSNFNLKGIN